MSHVTVSAPHPQAVAAKVESQARLVALELGQSRRFVTVRLTPVMSTLWCAAALLVVLSLAQDLIILLWPELGFTDRIYRLDLDTEASLPTWYSSALLLVCALSLLLIALRERQDDGLWRALPWFLLAVLFCLLSLDEVATLHEGISAALSKQIEHRGLFFFAWTLPALVVCLGGLACFLPFILRFRGLDLVLLLGSAAVFLSGALGMEMLGGAEAEAHGVATLTYRLYSTLEESLEFAGVLIFLLFLLRRLRAAHSGVALRFI